MAQAQLTLGKEAHAPLDYTVPNAQEIELIAINAVFDGSGAASSFLPAIEIISDSGHIVSRTVTATAVAAGGSAEVTFAPFLRSAGGGGGGGGTQVVRSAVTLTNPAISADAGNSYPWVRTVTGGDFGVWAFQNGVEGIVVGEVMVPPAYKSGGSLVLAWAADAGAAANVVLALGSKPLAAGTSYNPVGYTTEANQTVAVAANDSLIVTTFTLTPAIAADNLLLVEIIRRGNNASDTLAGRLLLFGAWLETTVTT